MQYKYAILLYTVFHCKGVNWYDDLDFKNFNKLNRNLLNIFEHIHNLKGKFAVNHSSEEPVKATFYSVYTCTWYAIGYYQLDLKAKNSSQNMSLGTERLKVRYRRYMDTCYDHGGNIQSRVTPKVKLK